MACWTKGSRLRVVLRDIGPGAGPDTEGVGVAPSVTGEVALEAGRVGSWFTLISSSCFCCLFDVGEL